MNYTLLGVLGCVALFGILAGAAFAGHRYGHHRFVAGDRDEGSFGAITAAVFAIFGLLLAFALNGATGRLELRRHLTVQEANDIGTAYLRLDLLPAQAQPELRALFSRYAASRVRFSVLTDPPAARREMAVAAAMQDTIWAKAVAASSSPEFQSARILLLPALNQMIDITTTRMVSIVTHMPMLMFVVMLLMAVMCAWLAGYDSGGKPRMSRLHAWGFAGLTALAFYVILDCEFPRLGVVRIGAASDAIVEVAEKIR